MYIYTILQCLDSTVSEPVNPINKSQISDISFFLNNIN